MTLTDHHQTQQDQTSPEALIPEARELHRRRQRRALTLAAAGLACGAVAAAAYLLTTATAATTSSPSGQRADATAGTTVVPKDPTAVAIGSHGALYVVDPGRQQILKRLPDGRFDVAVGTGVAGDSGDGGLATHAEIDLWDGSNIVISPDGTLYFSQSVDHSAGWRVVRKVTPNGRISTVVGAHPNCRAADAGTKDIPTGDVSAGTLAIAPNGDLSMLAVPICVGGRLNLQSLRTDGLTHRLLLDLTPDGKLVVAAHSSTVVKANSGMCGSGLAYSAGVLYASCSYGSPHPRPQPDAFLIIEPN